VSFFHREHFSHLARSKHLSSAAFFVLLKFFKPLSGNLCFNKAT
jgi:hypothetical protein